MTNQFLNRLHKTVGLSSSIIWHAASFSISSSFSHTTKNPSLLPTASERDRERVRVREKNQINNNKNVYSSSARDSGANVVVDEPACRNIMLMDLSTVETQLTCLQLMLLNMPASLTTV